MAAKTQWYYKQTNSPRYPGLPGRDIFLTELAARTAVRPVTGTGRPLGRPRTSSTLRSPEEQRLWLSHIGRPTVSSGYKHEHPKLSFSYDNRTVAVDGRYLWPKMDYFNDVHRCMWSRHGSMKTTYKLRA